MEGCATEITLQIKSEPDEHQNIDENNHHSNIMTDNDEEMTNIDNTNGDITGINQQSHNNSLCTGKDQELLDSIKSEFSIDELLIKSENHSEMICENKQHTDISHHDVDNKSISNDNNDKNLLLNEQYNSKLECNICKKKFNRKDNLKNHLHSHGTKKTHHYDKKIVFKSGLVKHQSAYVHRKRYQCNICGKMFATTSCLERHSLVHTDEKPYQCEICNKKFTEKSSLEDHLWLVHTMNKRYQCHICNKEFWINEDLKEHLSVHKSDRPYPVNAIFLKKVQPPNNGETCITIENHCENTNENNKHSSISFGDGNNDTISNDNSDQNLLVNEQCNNKFECYVCKKKFKHTVNLVTHLYSHVGEKTHQCKHCNRKFMFKSTLVKHLLTHITNINDPKNVCDEKLYQCDICNLKFKSKFSLNYHLSWMHTMEKLYKCQICNEEFLTNEDLKEHHSVHVEGRCSGEDQSTDDNKRHSNIIIDNNEEIRNNGNKNDHISNNNQQSLNNSLCTIRDNEELFEFMKDELNIDETCIKIENHSDNENNDGRNETINNANSDKDPLGNEHYNNDMECNICNVEFYRKESFKTHLYLHAATITYHCNGCTRKFVCKSARERHQSIHIRKERYQCKICGKMFGTASYLKRHSFVHNMIKRYQCDICKRKYKLKFNYEKHLTSEHSMEKLLHIDNKNTGGDNQELLSSNKNDDLLIKTENHSDNEYEKIYRNNHHSGISFGDGNNETISNDKSDKDQLVNEQYEEYQCKICDKKFTKELSLRVHSWIHAFHYCNICNKKFKQKRALAMHLVTHKQLKYRQRYQCNICNRKFELERSLNNHLCRKHNDTKRLYQCDICGKKFRRNKDLENHSSIHAESDPGDEDQNTGENDYQSNVIIDNDKEITNTDNKKDDDINYNQQSENNKLCSGEDNQEIIMKNDTKDEKFLKIENHSEKFYENNEHSTISLVNGDNEPIIKDNSDVDLLENEELPNEQFQCKICDKKFRQEMGLKMHFFIHKFSHCTICNKKFRHKKSLQGHLLIHGDWKDYYQM